MQSILFVCTHNRFRSALAECFFRHLLEVDGRSDDWTVSSAGTWAEESLGATAEAIQAASEMGLDLSKHLSRAVTDEILRAADMVVTMESGHKEALLQEFPWLCGGVRLFSEFCGQPAYDIPDPYITDEPPEAIAEEIESLLKDNYQSILKLAESKAFTPSYRQAE